MCTIIRRVENKGLVRGFGLLQATALNMTNMVGIGPFVTIPLIIAAMGGPQCMLGWVAGARAGAMRRPGVGGTGGGHARRGRHVSLPARSLPRHALGALVPFLFIWQFIFSGPLEIASGYIGFAQYLGYFWRGMGPWETRAVAMGVGVVAVALLWRRITAIGRLTVVLWAGMLVTVTWVIVSGLMHFNARMAFDFPPDAFTFSRGFLPGPGQRHADRHVRFSGLLRYLLRGRRGAAAGAHHPARHPAFRGGGGADLRPHDAVHHGRGAVAGGHAIEVRGGAVHGGDPRPAGRAPR